MISRLLTANFTRFDPAFMNAIAHDARAGERAPVAHARLSFSHSVDSSCPPDAALTRRRPLRRVVPAD